MENEERNTRPGKQRNNTPTIVLIVLFSIVVILLYAGWNLMSDDAKNVGNLTVNDEITESVDTDLIDLPAPVPLAPEEIVIEPDPTPEAKKSPEVVEKKSAPNSTSSYSGTAGIHVVKSGETFFSIANKFNTSLDNLKNMNPDVNPDQIKVGVTKINVPVQAIHTVGPGDILRVVANKYNISVEALMAANGKTRNYAERGEKLLIPHKNKVQ